nr:MAG TPA: hypothetical protein [Caudoviricetes sp.]
MATNTNVLLFNAEEFERQTYNNMRSTLKASNALDGN